MMSHRFTHIAVLLLLLCSAAGAQSNAFADFTDIRPKQNSPLSRFGLGDPLDRQFTAQLGMGGLTATYQDPFHLNLENPASLASLQSSSFEVGIYGRASTIEDATSSADTYQGNLRYLALGFPLRNPININLDQQGNTWNAGMAFSLVATTLVGYDLRLEGNDPEFGLTSNSLKGTGGTYRASWSTAYRFRGLSVGANLNYNFGKLSNSRLVVFDSIPDALGSELLEEISLGGISLGYGIQYTYNFKTTDADGEEIFTGKRIIVGVNGNLQSNVQSESSELFRRFSPNSGLFVSDTLSVLEGQEGEVTLPVQYNFGVAYEDINKLFIGLEYGSKQFSDYANTARPEQLSDASRFAIGVQYIPRISSFNNYWQRVRYRAGLRLEEDPRTVDGVQARRDAVTVGAGFPIRLPRQQISFLDVALEFGKFGVPDVIDENYVQLSLGFSLNDNSWFFKRKLN